jgi:protein-disulfide isomerase
MSFPRAFAVLAATSLFALGACSRPDAGPPRSGGHPAPAAVDDATVVAEVDGVAITGAELEEAAAGALVRVRQEEYEIRRQALEALIAERLVAAKARERGISPEALLEQEIERRAEKPATDYVETLYARNKDRFAGQSREQALARIEEILLGRAQAEGQRSFERALRDEAEVSVHLEPPRVAVDVPRGAPATGPTDAPVTIVEFTDYQCPYCHRAQDVVERILDEYSGRVRFVHLDFPLDNHAGAVPAARAARCAGEQGRFWDFHRSLMKERGTLDNADLEARAAGLKLDAGKFARCLASDRYDEEIRAELDLGSGIGVTGTPAYFINGRMVSGARPFPDFAEIIDAELAGT